MNFNFEHNITLTYNTPLVNQLKKSSSLFFTQNMPDDFYFASKTPKTNYIIFLINSIFSKNGNSVVVT